MATQLNNRIPDFASALQPVSGVGQNPFALGHLMANRLFADASNTKALDAFTMNQAALRGHELELNASDQMNDRLKIFAQMLQTGNANIPSLTRNENADMMSRVAQLFGIGPIQHANGPGNRNILDKADLTAQEASTAKDLAAAGSDVPPTSPVTVPVNNQPFQVTKENAMQQRATGPASGSNSPKLTVTTGKGGAVYQLQRPTTREEMDQFLSDRDQQLGNIPSQPMNQIQSAEVQQAALNLVNTLSTKLAHRYQVLDTNNTDPMTGGTRIRAYDYENRREVLFRIDQSQPGSPPTTMVSDDNGKTWYPAQ